MKRITEEVTTEKKAEEVTEPPEITEEKTAEEAAEPAEIQEEQTAIEVMVPEERSRKERTAGPSALTDMRKQESTGIRALRNFRRRTAE